MIAARLACKRSTWLLSMGCLIAFGACSNDATTEPSGAAGASGAANDVSGGAGNAGSPIGGAPSSGAAGQSNAAGAPNGPAGEAGSAGEAGAPALADVIPDFNGCTSEAYQDRSAASASRSVGIATMGLSFTPKCMTIKVGQTVRWEGNLSAHPLAPGNPDHADAGSIGSPIVETSSGQSVEFSFEAPGTYPYYCEIHSFGAGKGMAGVVHVAP